MAKVIQIEVPDELASIVDNPEYVEIIKKKIVEVVIEEEFNKGVISKDVLNHLAKEEDVLLENEEKIIRKLREKEKERVKWL